MGDNTVRYFIVSLLSGFLAIMIQTGVDLIKDDYLGFTRSDFILAGVFLGLSMAVTVGFILTPIAYYTFEKIKNKLLKYAAFIVSSTFVTAFLYYYKVYLFGMPASFIIIPLFIVINLFFPKIKVVPQV
jgi:hypothetical protein